MQLIKNQTQLQECVDILSNKPQIALDLEFDKNRFRFGFNICLVQMYDGTESYIVDPLEKIDFKPLFEIYENANIEKVVFSFDEDLRLLHSLGCFPKNIIDVHIAARMLNFQPISHTNLVKEILGIVEVPSAQNSNWFTRPLTQKMLIYAENDVLHLFNLKTKLFQKAKEKGVLSWVLEENKALELLDYSKEPNIVYKKDVDKKGLTEYQWFIFENLLDFREAVAEEFNKPSYQIIGKEDLKSLVLLPSKVKNWLKMNGVFKGIQNEAFLSKLKELISNLERQADSLELSRTNRAKMNKGEPHNLGISKAKRTEIKEKIYDPIKQKIGEIYGENTAAFILPNKLALELSAGNTDKLLSYKKELFYKFKE